MVRKERGRKRRGWVKKKKKQERVVHMCKKNKKKEHRRVGYFRRKLENNKQKNEEGGGGEGKGERFERSKVEKTEPTIKKQNRTKGTNLGKPGETGRARIYTR